MGDLSATDWWPVRALVLAVTVLAVLAALRWVHGGTWRAVAGIGCLGLVLVNIGAAVNAHYAYWPTLGAVVGDDGLASLPALQRTTVPDEGVLVGVGIPGPVSGFKTRPAAVWVPPAWFRQPRPSLPVVMLLHGSPGDPTNWSVGGGAPQTANAWARDHGGTAPILVMPDINGSLLADTECVDSRRGKAETYLTVDLPRFVQDTFGVAAPGKTWVMAGLSEGGTCSMVLALRHPQQFPTFGNFSGLVGPRDGETNDPGDTLQELFDGSQQAFAEHEPTVILGQRSFPSLGGWFEVGTSDPAPYDATKTLVPLAGRAGIATCAVYLQGGEHTFEVWKQSFEDALPWFAARTGLVPERPDMTAKCAPRV